MLRPSSWQALVYERATPGGDHEGNLTAFAAATGELLIWGAAALSTLAFLLLGCSPAESV